MKKRVLACALTLLLVCALLPGAVSADNGYISRVDLSVKIPKTGDVFNGPQDDAGAAAVGSDVHYTVEESKWYNEWGRSESNMVFEAGAKYYLEIDLKPASGYQFDEDTIVTINSQPAKAFKKAYASTWYAVSEYYTMPPEPVNPFTDVEKGAYYETPVLWAVNHTPQITNGMSEKSFAPDANCTRGQVVTFLWRANGCPDTKMETCPFTDVSPNDYFYKAVLWAVENKITNGTSPTTFSPNQTCTRAQVVTFLWRASHEPNPNSSTSPFTDVTGDYYYKAVLWAVDNGVTNGTSASTFSPNQTCTRGQIVTFLYRDMA